MRWYGFALHCELVRRRVQARGGASKPAMDEVQILALLCEDPTVDAVVRRSDAHPDDVSRLKADGGRAAAWYQDRVLRKLDARRVQVDVTPAFGRPETAKAEEPVWTWTASDPSSRLIISWLVGDRDRDAAKFFLDEVASRLARSVGFVADDDGRTFLEIADGATSVDESLLNRLYGHPGDGAADAKDLEASLASQRSLDTHLHCRRFDRFSDSFSRAVLDHARGLALSALHENFVRVLDSLGTAPAVAAGIVDAPWRASHLFDVLRMWRDLKTGPWYERVSVLGAAPQPTRARERPFDVLLGLKLSIVRRAAGTLVLHFGPVRPHHSGTGTVGAYALHVQCAWRFAGPSRIATGRSDLWQYAGPGRWPDNWSYEDGFSLQDQVFDRLIGSYDATTGSWHNERERFFVTGTFLGPYGDVRLSMTDGYEISIFPDGSEGAGEAWRFFSPGSDHHLVFPEKQRHY